MRFLHWKKACEEKHFTIWETDELGIGMIFTWTISPFRPDQYAVMFPSVKQVRDDASRYAAMCEERNAVTA